MGGLEVVLVVLAIGYGVEKAKEQWRHGRDWHAANIARDHPDWHPRKVARHARWRNRTWWWNEAREGFPSFKAAWREDREHVRHIRERRLLEHDNRISAWRDELRKLRAEHAKRTAPDGGGATAAAGPLPGSGGASGTGSPAGAGAGSGTGGGNHAGTIREPHPGTGNGSKTGTAPGTGGGNRTGAPREPAAGTGSGPRPPQRPTHMLTVRDWRDLSEEVIPVYGLQHLRAETERVRRDGNLGATITPLTASDGSVAGKPQDELIRLFPFKGATEPPEPPDPVTDGDAAPPAASGNGQPSPQQLLQRRARDYAAALDRHSAVVRQLLREHPDADPDHLRDALPPEARKKLDASAGAVARMSARYAAAADAAAATTPGGPPPRAPVNQAGTTPNGNAGGNHMPTGTAPSGELAGDSPYTAALNVTGQFEQQAQQLGRAGEQVEAELTAHEFHRDQQLMTHVRAMREALAQASQHATGMRQTLIANHAAGHEYHSTGKDAASSGLRTGS